MVVRPSVRACFLIVYARPMRIDAASLTWRALATLARRAIGAPARTGKSQIRETEGDPTWFASPRAVLAPSPARTLSPRRPSRKQQDGRGGGPCGSSPAAASGSDRGRFAEQGAGVLETTSPLHRRRGREPHLRAGPLGRRSCPQAVDDTSNGPRDRVSYESSCTCSGQAPSNSAQGRTRQLSGDVGSGTNSVAIFALEEKSRRGVARAVERKEVAAASLDQPMPPRPFRRRTAFYAAEDYHQD